MGSKKNKVLKAGVGYTVGNVMVKGINFLAIPIFGRMLSTEEMGVYTIFAAYEAVLFVIVGMALHSAIRSAKYEFEGQIDSFTSSVSIIYWVNMLLILIIGGIFHKPLSKILDLDLQGMILLVIYSFGVAVITLYNARISLDYEYKKYICISLASTIGNVGLSLLFITTIYNEERDFGRIFGITLSTVLVAVYIFYDIYKRAIPKFVKEYWKFGVKYSLPIIPHGISQVLLSQFDRIMINKIIGKSEAGIYGMVGNIKLVLTIISDSVSEAWATWFYEQIKNEKKDVIRKRASQLCVLFLIFTIGLMALSPEIVFIMGGEKYEIGKYIAIPMILDAFVLFIYNVIVPAEYYSKKTQFIMLGTMFAAVINILLNYVFIIRFGFIAAAYTTLFAYICYMILHWIISYKLMKFNIIPIKCVAFAFVMVSIMAVFDLAFVDNIFIRYGMCVIIIIPLGLKLLKDNTNNKNMGE